jgi:PAS domain S-box-containing protein
VLIADDSAMHRVRAAAALSALYDVEAHPDAMSALRALKERAPEAIVADLNMPGMSGIDLLRIVKQDPVLRPIPFILVTSEEQVAVRSLDAGADDFLKKPYGPEELRARVGAAARSRRMYHELEVQHTELVRVNGLLSRSESRTRAILHTAREGIFILTLEAEVESMNPSAERMLGLGRGEGGCCPFLDFVAEGDREAIGLALTAAAAAAPSTGPAQSAGLLKRGGGEIPAECRITRIDTPSGPALCVFVRDLTESRRLQLELHQAQKLEAVGRLAAGIAHEINTPVQFIGDNTRFLADAFEGLREMLRRQDEAVEACCADRRQDLAAAAAELDLPYMLEEVPKTISRTLEGVRRVATIVRAMKEFAHPDQKEMVATDLNRALEATLEVARNEYKYVADVETALGPVPLVACHAGDVNQVFLNIIVNAAHAIADMVKGTEARGRIRVATRSEGDSVVIEIEDTGGGIPAPIRDKVFDPFFTTKPVGRGTGQGLAIARSVVEKHGGVIRFETEEGKGTRFQILLPVRGERRSAP